MRTTTRWILKLLFPLTPRLRRTSRWTKISHSSRLLWSLRTNRISWLPKPGLKQASNVHHRNYDRELARASPSSDAVSSVSFSSTRREGPTREDSHGIDF